MLVTVKGKWVFGAARGSMARPASERLRKLAKSLDRLAQADDFHLKRVTEIASLRREAALELHGICADFVRELNELVSEITLEFEPLEYRPDNFQDEGVNLFQINAQGRILQIEFEATPELISTEDFRVPYIMSGEIRCFNQQLLERDLIEEQLLFYTMEKTRHFWRYFDARTYRSGPVDAVYLAGLMEQLTRV